MQLSAILSEINFLAVHGSTTVEITGISCDARRVLPGDLYVALQREFLDGQADIELAIERGAAAGVCRRLGNIRSRVTRIEVADTRLALAEASAVFYGNAGQKLHVIAVAGGLSPWKTAHLTKQLLQAGGIKTGLISSLGHEVMGRNLPCTSAIEPSDIQKLFAAMVRAGCTACVLELPSISPAALKGIPINVMIFAGGEQNLRALSVFLQSRANTPVCGIVNADDETGRNVALSTIFKMQLSFGFGERAEVRAADLALSTTATRFNIELAGCAALCEMPLVGRENIHHLLGAAAASLSALTAKQVLAAMAHVRTPPASLEAIPNEHGLAVFVDETRDAARLPELIAGVKQLQPRRILLALGSPEGASGRDRFELGRAAGEYASHVILTTDNSGTEDLDSICSAISQGLDQARHCTYHVQADREQAIRELVSMAEPGDIALILGKGARAHQIVGNTIVPFNDREVALECLQSLIPTTVRSHVSALAVA